MTTDEIPEDRDVAAVAYAKAHLRSDTLAIDMDPKTSDGEDGVWVEAWVFVPNAVLPAEGNA